MQVSVKFKTPGNFTKFLPKIKDPLHFRRAEGFTSAVLPLPGHRCARVVREAG